jgi:hypothetical protein
MTFKAYQIVENYDILLKKIFIVGDLGPKIDGFYESIWFKSDKIDFIAFFNTSHFP